MTVILTSAPASACAAVRPPKPAPTMTTRCRTGCPVVLFMILPIVPLAVVASPIVVSPTVVLPILSSLYKIQRDGNWLPNFRGRAAPDADALACAVRG